MISVPGPDSHTSDSPGPCPTPTLSAVSREEFRGELGWLSLRGTGGGSICAEVCLEGVRLGGEVTG